MPIILILDDDSVFRELVAHGLRAMGYSTAGAGDGARGIEMARRAKPAAVLLNLNLPRVDGFLFLDLLAGNPDLCRVPVIAVSAAGSFEQQRRARARGVEAILVKGRHSIPEYVERLALRAGAPDAPRVGPPKTAAA